MIARALSMAALLIAGLATMAADQPIGAKDQAALAKTLAGLTPRKPLECLPLGSQHYTSTAYGPVLVYTVTRGLLYVNRTTGGCEGAARGDVLTSVQYQVRTCSGDVVNTLQPITHVPTGSCTLGYFTPYTKTRPR